MSVKSVHSSTTYYKLDKYARTLLSCVVFPDLTLTGGLGWSVWLMTHWTENRGSGEGFDPGLTGQGFDSGLSGQGFDSSLTGQGFDSGLSGQGFDSGLTGQGFDSGLTGQGFDSGLFDSSSTPRDAT